MPVSVVVGMSQTAELGAAALPYLDPDEWFVRWSAGETMTQMASPTAALWTAPLYRGPNAPLASPTTAYFAVDPAGTTNFDADAKAMFDILVDTYTGITDVHFWILVGSDDGNPGSPGENGFLSCSRHNTFQPDLETFVSANPTYLTQGTNQVTINIHLGPEVVVTQPDDFVDELGHLTATGKNKSGGQFLSYLGASTALTVPDVRAVSTATFVASGDLTPTSPTGVAIGDHVEIFFIARGVEAPAAPTGWTLRGTPSVVGIDLAVYSRNGGWQSGDTMPTFTALAAAAGAVSVAYIRTNLNFPYHIASRIQTADVLYADHAGSLTVTPGAIGTANPGVLLVTSVATPDDNALAFQAGGAQGFTDEASGAAYEKTGGPAATQMAFMLATKSQTTQADAITQPTFEQTVNGPDAWESSRHALQGSPIFTGSGTPTESADTSAGSGTFSSGVSGSGTPFEANDTSAGSGTFTPPSVTGSGSPTEAADTSAGAATFDAPIFTGTGTPTELADTSAGAATFTAPSFTGSGTPIEANDTSAGIGTFEPAPISGSGTPSEQADTSIGSGTFGSVFTGSGTTTEQADTSSGTGDYTPPPIIGSGTPNEGPDTSTGTGTLPGPPGTGGISPEALQLAATRSPIAWTSWGAFGPGFIWIRHRALVPTGSGSPTEADDTSVGTGTFTPPPITGSGTPSEQNDTSVGSGTFLYQVTGAGIPTEQNDTSTGTGTFIAPISGSGTPTEQADTSVGTGTFTPPPITGSGTPTEEDDTSAGTGTGGEVITLGPVICELLIPSATCQTVASSCTTAILSPIVNCEVT